MSPLQKRLVLIFALLLALQAGLNLVKYFADLGEGGRFGGDFISFWQAARHLRADELGAIYDADGWRRALVGRPDELSWFVYPPFALFGLWALGGLSYLAAVFWWSVAPLPAYFALAWLLAKRAGLSGAQALLGVAASALPLLSANLFTGQTGTWIAVFLLSAAYFWGRRPILAGVFIGLIAIKPQMGLLLPFALAAAGQWRSFAAAAGTVVGLAAASLLWLGATVWTDYFAMLELFGTVIGQGYAGIRQLAVGPYVSLQAVGAPKLVVAGVQTVLSLAVLAVVAKAFRQARDEGDRRTDLRFGLLAVGTLLATPYALAYDTPLLVLALIPILARAWRSGWQWPELAALTALVALPFVPSSLIDSGIPFGFGALLLAFAALCRRYAIEGRARLSSASMAASEAPLVSRMTSAETRLTAAASRM